MVVGVVEAVGKRVGLAALYLVAAVIGRASVVDGNPMALVWPAGGLAIAWLLVYPSMRDRLVDIPLITAIGVAIPLINGRDAAHTAVLAAGNLTAVLSVVLLVRWWCPATVRRGTPPSATPHSMLGFLAAVTVGSAAGVAAGAAGCWLVGEPVSPASLVIWGGRNVCGMTAVGITALLIADWIRHGRRTTFAHGGAPELVALFAATAALVACDYFTPFAVSFLLPAAAVWAGNRFAALPVALHALVGGAGILWLTYVGEGPFVEAEDEHTNILLAQLFIAMTLVIGLLLAAAREAREAMSQELLTFARRVAHDLRNPISVVEAWAGELSTSLASAPLGPPEGAPMMVAGIERATTRMRDLVDGLLADATSWNQTPTSVTVDLADLVADVAAQYDAADQVETFGVRTVSGDPVLLRQLVDNLLANALKYAHPDRPSAITVSAHRAAGRVVVQVTDNGVGIPDGAHDWIFDPFRRAHGDAFPGTGLGLSTCRRIVERHGGSMHARPCEHGPGSVFEFDLPHASTTQPRPAPIKVSA